MNILKAVRERIQESDLPDGYELQGALAEAERMADEFDHVKPAPYVVPIERYSGLPILGEHKETV